MSWTKAARSAAIWRVMAALSLIALLVETPRAARAVAPLCYVNASVAGGLGNGTSWSNAYADLQAALADPGCAEIWVAAGVYKPSATDPGVSFVVLPGVAIYGGFHGTESYREQRNWATHLTILSGDIDGNDINLDGNQVDEIYSNIQGTNSVHVVMVNGQGASQATSSTVLDGFTITGGSAGSGVGGGLYCAGSGAGKGCSPTLSNLIFSGNQALGGFGGALENAGGSGGVSSPILQRVTFAGNAATQGGAMYNGGYAGNSSPNMSDVTFEGNYATGAGGALVNSAYGGGTSNPTLSGVTFSNNTSGDVAGAVLNSAGDGYSSPILINVTFSGNHAANLGGALFNSSTGGESSPTILNATFQGNSAGIDGENGAGGAVYSNATEGGTTSPLLYGVILWGNTAAYGSQVYNDPPATVSISYSMVQGSCESIPGADCTGGHNVGGDPLLGPLANNGGSTKTMALLPGSPARDSGSSIACPATDQRWAPRPMDGNHDTVAACDIGAFEASMFADLPVAGKEWMEPWIDVFYANGITTGCGVGPLIYCPEDNVTRAEMAVFLLRAKHGASYTPPPATHTFYDVPVAGKEWMEPWIDEFYAEGITTGCGLAPLRYCPEQNVTRAEMAVFVLRTINGPGWIPLPASGIFADVPVPGKEWMQPWIEHFYTLRITGGCAVGPLRYCPENNTTRAEMAVFIGRAYGLYP